MAYFKIKVDSDSGRAVVQYLGSIEQAGYAVVPVEAAKETGDE